ncbi:MAG TPA: glycosyltransferase family 4 protein [Bacteroidota bacterium]|nr:glycosyltransferase family 4 protein [Bacteroidota bacterium]
MNILYITHFFPPELNGGARRVSDLASEWVKQGNGVTVATGFPTHPTGIVPSRYKHRWLAEEIHDGVRVLRAKKFNVPNKGFLPRILNHVSSALSAFLVGIFHNDAYDVVIATSPPLFMGFSGVLLKFFKNVPLVFEVRDLWPQQAIDLGIIQNSLLIWLSRKLEHFFYSSADHIVVVTEASRRTLIGQKVPSSKISVIRNGVNIDAFRSPSVQNMKIEFSIKDKILVTYGGTFGLSQGLHSILEAAKRFSDAGIDRFHFLFAGDGVERDSMISYVRTNNLHNVIILPTQPFERMESFYRSSDVHIVPLRKLPLFSHTIPSKIYEIMACGGAMVCMVDGECRSIIEEASAGVFVEPENVDQLCSCLLKLDRDTITAFKSLGENGRVWVEKNCDRKKQANLYSKLLKGLVSRRYD